ncbi:50S ribosomal protein L13 [Candidatus Roizmanbacteria bacterium]|nr:50S ribosomal protein L13 [Candidatus Roizmanbacteria bacterium]
MVNVTRSTKSVSAKNIVQKWHVIDAKNKILGRIANEIAHLLQGKHKTTYVPHLDSGDYVVVTNAKHVVVTGNKKKTKEYSYFSGYPGGLKTVTFETMIEKNPGEVFRHAVSGKLPKNKLRDRRLARLYVFGEAEHPYSDKVTQQS